MAELLYYRSIDVKFVFRDMRFYHFLSHVYENDKYKTDNNKNKIEIVRYF